MSVPNPQLAAQSAYYLVTGIWPLVHYDSFERISGPKSERWLVETVGGLVTAVGISLAIGATRAKPGAETTALAAGSAAALAAIDLLYLRRGRLRWVYGLDAAGQAGFLATAARSALRD